MFFSSLIKLTLPLRRLKGGVILKRLQGRRLYFAGWFYADKKAGSTGLGY
ncbi:MAG: hypothetical protein JWR09_5616 [Mucilaginibacter sp.]|nr:hypothetical protein [Mucilaginibacter sp.]